MTQGISERDFLRQVCELASFRGWEWLHLRPGMTRDSWRTPISGSLGKGWPDLVLVRSDRILFVELKRDGLDATSEQWSVLRVLAPIGECYVWHPADWALVESTLR